MPKFLSNVDVDASADISTGLTVAADGAGQDVKFFGVSSGKYMLWDASEDTLKVPDLELESDESNNPVLTIRSTINTTAAQGLLKFTKESASENGEKLGQIQWYGRDDSNNLDFFAYIEGEIASNINASEMGKVTIGLRNDSNTSPGLVLTANSGSANRVDATIGNTTDSVTTIAGNLTISGGIGTIAAGTWNGTVVASAYLDADTAHLSGVQTFTGNKTFADGIRYSYSKHQAASSGDGSYGVGADILYGTGSQTVVAGSIYTLRGGVWTLIDADFENRCRDLVGIAVGPNSSTNGMLIKGCVTLKDPFVAGTDSAGMPVYASVTDGKATLVAPTGSGDIVRILGYSLDSGSKSMYFNPDSTYVKIA